MCYTLVLIGFLVVLSVVGSMDYEAEYGLPTPYGKYMIKSAIGLSMMFIGGFKGNLMN